MCFLNTTFLNSFAFFCQNVADWTLRNSPGVSFFPWRSSGGPNLRVWSSIPGPDSQSANVNSKMTIPYIALLWFLEPLKGLWHHQSYSPFHTMFTHWRQRLLQKSTISVVSLSINIHTALTNSRSNFGFILLVEDSSSCELWLIIHQNWELLLTQPPVFKNNQISTNTNPNPRLNVETMYSSSGITCACLTWVWTISKLGIKSKEI